MSLFCNTRVGRVRVVEPFAELPAGYRYLLELDNGDTRLLTEDEFRSPITLAGRDVRLDGLVAFAGGWRTV